MKRIGAIVIAGLLLNDFYAAAQNVVGGNQSKGMDMNTVPYGIISTFGSAEKTTKGSKYLYEDWQAATIEADGNEIKNCPVNIDVQNQSIEINTDKGVRVIPTSKIKRLIVGYENLNKQVFVPTLSRGGSQLALDGLFEVVSDSEIMLLKYYYIHLQKSSYNAALDMGENVDKQILKSKYFFFQNGTLHEVPAAKKKFLELFETQDAAVVNSLLKEKRLSLKSEDDLVLASNLITEKNIKLKSK